MKNHLLFLSLFFFNLLNAQDTLHLSINNEVPRVDDKIKISFSTDFLTDEINNQLNTNEIELKKSFSSYHGSINKLENEFSFKKEGRHTIGPFNFKFNGDTLTTDSLVIEVAEKLPSTEGVWVRFTHTSNGSLLIVEQFLKTKKKESKDTHHSFSRSVTGGSDEESIYTEVKLISEDGIKIKFKQSKTTTSTLLGKDFSYSFKMYKVEFNDDNTEPFILKKKHFNNFPKKTSYEEITLKKQTL